MMQPTRDQLNRRDHRDAYHALSESLFYVQPLVGTDKTLGFAVRTSHYVLRDARSPLTPLQVGLVWAIADMLLDIVNPNADIANPSLEAHQRLVIQYWDARCA